MSRQYNKVIKRHRRNAYIKRSKAKSQERKVARPATPASTAAPGPPPAAPEPPPVSPTTAAA